MFKRLFVLIVLVIAAFSITPAQATSPAPGQRGAVPKVVIHGCPAGFYCFYELRDFGGRMIQISTCPTNGSPIHLSDYGFADQASSWVVNRAINYLNVYEQGPGYWNFLWSEVSYSAQSYVGANADNRADLVECFT